MNELASRLRRVDPQLARRMISSSTSVMFCTYVTAKPQAL
jgi:hypothetical protein